MLTMKSMSLAVFVFAVAACSQNADGDASRDTGRRVGTDSGMAGMAGMRGGASTRMMADVDAHLGMMRTVTADSMKAMLPMHRQMVANLIAQLDREMRDMNMTGDAGWKATLDSLRQDLRVMPDLSAQALRGLMPTHSSRVRRVIDMHRSMMANMPH